MSRLWRIAVLIAALTCAGKAVAAEVIHSFDSDVEVAADGELTVTETLRVRAENNAMRHGIYRDFPLTFRDAGGRVREVTFHLIKVSRDGHGEPYHTERTHGFLRIYAGDKDVVIPTGEHTYTFAYRTGRQVRWFDGKPELNWNVTGNFWRFPIEAATYRLHLLDGAAPLRWTAYTGRLGARGTDWRGSIGDGTLSVATTRRLAPGEGLTVVAALPENVVDPPSANTLLWYQAFDNRQWIIAGIGFLAVLIFYFAAWEEFGRDPKGGTVIPLFHPPAGISPALANYIHNWGLTREKWRAFTAASLALAVRGAVLLDRSGGGLTLKVSGKAPQGDTPLAPEERSILTKLQTNGGTIVVDKAHAVTVADLGTKFTTAVVTENHNRFFRRNLGYVTAGALMTGAIIAATVIFGGLQDNDISILVGFGFAGFFVGVFVLPALMSLFGPGPKFAAFGRLAFLAIFGFVFISIVFNVFGALFLNGLREALPALSAVLENDPFPFVLVTAFAALNGIFLYLMKAPTVLGRKIMDQLDGLRLYLETAESDRLNARAPEITADRFEALLPYAVALDVEKPWAHAFEAALRRAHPEDTDPMGRYQPGWYGGGNWSSGNFGNAMASTVGSVSGAFASAVPVSSGSSGFSGGGGSGGGGGGGGGGGW